MKLTTLLVSLIGIAFAAQYTVSPSDNWISRLQTLAAGDTLTFNAGTYTVSSKLSASFPGTASAPIVVQGASGATVIISRGNANQNTIDIGQGSYFTIKNIRFAGGSRGIRVGETGNVNNAVFDGLKVYNTATTAMSFNQGGRTYSNIRIANCEIYNTGTQESECIYMGCQDNGCTTSNSIIEKNFCHDTTGATSGSMGSGIQVKTGSYNNIIRNNVIVDVKGAGVLIYDDYGLGRNQVYGNFIWRTGDNGIQATSGANIYNNIVALPTGTAISIINNQVQSGQQLRNVAIHHNTIYSTSGNRGINVGSTTSGSTFNVRNNFISVASSASPTGLPSGAVQSNNIAGSATTYLVNPTSTTAPNFYPKSGTSLIGGGTNAVYSLVPQDFNCNARSSTAPTVGAYEYSTTSNPGPQLGKSFKGGSCP